MGELLLPGVEIFIIPAPPRPVSAPARKTRFTAVAVAREGTVRLLDTHTNNRIAEALIDRGAIDSLRGSRIVRSEVTVGRSRFDFLLADRLGEFFCEVKSCNLIERRIALFPDAPTARGRRHVEELAKIAEHGGRAALLFVVHDPHAERLLPDIHTDLDFAAALVDVEKRFPGAAAGTNERFRFLAAAITMNRDLSVTPSAKPVPIPLGALVFPAGWYLYAGSAERGLSKRIARHKRLRKKMHWHIDYLRRKAEMIESFPIRSSRRDECLLAGAVGELAEEAVDRFGSSDCPCASHLFRFGVDPRGTRSFHDLIARFRHSIGEASPLPAR